MVYGIHATTINGWTSYEIKDCDNTDSALDSGCIAVFKDYDRASEYWNWLVFG